MEIRKGYIQNWAKILIWILKLQIVWTWKWDLYNPLMSTNRPEFCKDRGEYLEGFLNIFKILKPQENQKQLLALSVSRSFSCQTELLAEKEISDERNPDQCGLEEFFLLFSDFIAAQIVSKSPVEEIYLNQQEQKFFKCVGGCALDLISCWVNRKSFSNAGLTTTRI